MRDSGTVELCQRKFEFGINQSINKVLKFLVSEDNLQSTFHLTLKTCFIQCLMTAAIN